MQVLPSTAKDIAKELGIKKYNLKDPTTNKIFGEYYLMKLLRQFGGDPELALAAYHSGPGRVENLMKITGAKDFQGIRHRLGQVGKKYPREVMARLEKLATAKT
jgi:soluble lytic murein transglycosylase-like protein